MTTDHQAERLSKLETLFCEQEYTIETLNTIVTQQNSDIKHLSSQLELLRLQFREIKNQLPELPSGDEKPPHY